jgi:CRISPR/Cas system-associated exonuclease Cas4 (RecB family)
VDQLRIFESASAAARLGAAAAFLRGFPPAQPITIVAATRGAADDLARRIALERGATIGLSRFSLTQFAARVAVTRLAGRGVAAATMLGAEAVAARAAFDASEARSLTYLAPVADSPGFSRSLAHTISELRAGDAAPDHILASGVSGVDLARLFLRADQEFVDASSADRARLFATAAEAAGDTPELTAPLLLLDIAVDSRIEERFVRALCRTSSAVFATVPLHDDNARRVLVDAGGIVERGTESRSTTLDQLRAFLFSGETPPERALDSSLEFFSAPGEGREAVEVARRVLEEAHRGVAFDEMAIVIRSPQQYHGLVEHALSRAGIPAWFDRGTRRPHPAGRAFLALLGCAAEKLSARRFAEYLSLGQIPSGDGPASWTPSADEVFVGLPPVETQEPASVSDDSRTLPAPRRWERLIVEASVIGGNPERWARRLDGLAAQFARRAAELRSDDPDSPRAEGIDRDIARLEQLRAFAMPVITRMSSWPQSATWGVWLRELETFAPLVVRTPAHILRVLADLRPMHTVGPVTLDEVRSVLAERLRLVEREPPARRYGRVLVTSPSQVRGRAFRVVFVPGLAERMFPQKPRQDPLLLDAARDRLNAGAASGASPLLPTRTERGRRERLLLHLAVGSARERLYLSYPRLEVVEGRARVPSFYALDVLRGATGRIPDRETLERAAAECGDRSLAWPAPANPDRAVDEQEHDLAVLRELLDARDADAVRGQAQYILRQNAALRRSVTDRWGRAQPKWSQFDGLIRITERTRAALEWHRLTNPQRPYSLSALQRFAACPYQFVLGAIYRLQPAEAPEPLQRLDPLTRGSVMHRMQARFFRELEQRVMLPITSASVNQALAVLDTVIATVAEEYREELAPAIDRVWREEIAGIARDLRGWVRNIAQDGGEWSPRYFEYAFGLPIDEQRDPHSVPDPVIVGNRYPLRGSVDLVEERRADGALRVTDHKTGKDRTKAPLIIGGGAVLQPVLYSLVVEQTTRRKVVESRLSFCTAAAGYSIQPVALDNTSRRSGLEALEIIDRAVEHGDLAAAPAEGACAWCDFRVVCGPAEEERIRRKPQDRLRDLFELRSRP